MKLTILTVDGLLRIDHHEVLDCLPRRQDGERVLTTIWTRRREKITGHIASAEINALLLAWQSRLSGLVR